jgi:thiosulfate/3-mercaptopyruvate sulfurtransferase
MPTDADLCNGYARTLRLQVVDCRWELADPAAGRRVYDDAHVPGASFLAVDTDLSAPPGAAGRHPLPDAATFAEAAGRAGIGSGTTVLAYGSPGAERLWWLLRHFGHDACAVLIGGIGAWGGMLRGGPEQIEPQPFVPRARDDDTAAAEELVGRLRDPGLVVLDARAAERYRGEPNPIDNVPGRIPGARNAPWQEPLPGLPDGEVVAYCGSGVTACVVLHRLWLAGREGRLYPGSWSEWEQRPELPRETGST